MSQAYNKTDSNHKKHAMFIKLTRCNVNNGFETIFVNTDHVTDFVPRKSYTNSGKAIVDGSWVTFNRVTMFDYTRDEVYKIEVKERLDEIAVLINAI